MSRFMRRLASFALLALLSAAPTLAAEVPVSSTDAVVLEDGAQLWFVELRGPAVADGGSDGALLSEQSAFRGAAGRAGIPFREERAFRRLWNGLSVAIQPRDLGRLAALAEVSAVYPVLPIQSPTMSPVNDPELLTALTMTGADVAQNTLGLTGAGVRVGIIDSGLDYDHPDFGGAGTAQLNSPAFPGPRVQFGYDFVGDAFDGTNSPSPDPFPDGCEAHGTHVAGIVGANGGVKGVAPGVTFGAYKVFGCTGTTRADLMIAAMEMALEDGMQVVNMSIGSVGQWPSYPTATAATRLVNRGVVVVCSIGNRGVDGLYFTSAPGVGQKAIGTASVDNTHSNQNAFSATPDGRLFGYNAATGAPPPPFSGSAPLARTGTPTSAADACTALPAGSLAGRIALIRRGTCSFYQKAFNAMTAGAVGVVLYNNAAGQLNPTVAGSPPVTIPVVAVTAADGVELNNRIAAGPTTLTWESDAVSLPIATGGFISSFTSWGLSPDLALKPDLAAPGGFIRSTIPLELGTYGGNSGTSMASPHVAGAVALMLEAHPNTPSNAMRDILQNNASPRRSPSVANALEPVHHQGAGMVDIPAAVLATTRIEPGKLSVGETPFGSATASFTISNHGASAETYDLGNVPALATGPNTYVPTLVNQGAAASFSVNPVVVPAGGSATVDVTFTPAAALATGSLFGGYVDVAPRGGGESQQVPYAGIVGNYQAIAALAPTANGFPWLARRTGTTYTNQPSGASYTLVGTDVPFILIHLDHPASRIRLEVYKAVGGRSWHRALEIEDIARNTTATSFYALAWDGTTSFGNRTITVPNGDYVVRLFVLKANGDEDIAGDWQSWTSPVITLARPPAVVLQDGAETMDVGRRIPAEPFLAAEGGNPSSGPALLRFGLPRPGPVTLGVFDMAGRRLKEWSWSHLAAGEHATAWDGTNASGRPVGSGVVFYRLVTPDGARTTRTVRLE